MGKVRALPSPPLAMPLESRPDRQKQTGLLVVVCQWWLVSLLINLLIGSDLVIVYLSGGFLQIQSHL